MTDRPTIRLYDTMRREKVEFAPLDPKCVRMYVCGPTVYDHAHIGNARPAIVFDVLFRLLRRVYGVENVVYVRNITDVDDKIIARAQRDFPDMDLNEAIRHVTETTTKQYQDDMAALGCLPPTHEPRATENIPQMIALVKALIRNGHAYEAVGPEGREVLFDVVSMPDYGALSNRRIEDQRAGARIEAKDHKRNPGDFVLWKEAKAGEPGWNSPFGRGRPGWHLECSAMSDRFLWDELQGHLGTNVPPHVFDIHGGGIDLTFPHHENEIAQTRCGHGTDCMANVWMHNGYLQVEGRKMSKSEGNFVTVDDQLSQPLAALVPLRLNQTHEWEQRWNGLATRSSMLGTHYREPINWTARRFDETSGELYEWYEGLRAISFDHTLVTRASDEIIECLAEDLNTSEAMSFIRGAVRNGNWRTVGESLLLLGLLDPYFVGNNDVLLFNRKNAIDEDEIEATITERLQHLANRNFAEADRIRDELVAEGIQLMDYKDPDTGERRTRWEVKR